MRGWISSLAVAGLIGGLLNAATLEKLGVDDMIQKSTDIVQAKVVSAATVQRGPVIYTVSSISVSQRWKGPDKKTMDIFVPGGSYGGVRQTFSGVPQLQTGTEYVLFLWTGPSGMTQIVGLSQGILDLKLSSAGQVTADRTPIAENTLVDPKSKRPVIDDPFHMPLADLVSRIKLVLGAQRN